ncbi:MAG: hypothetical protein PF439_07880 [Helicobacteraceae bacterium]|nr:hypothetical protein [Helicobacteraceae bacterium]
MKFIESFLPKLFVTLIPSSSGVELYAELRKKSKLIRRFEKQNVEAGEMLEKEIKKLERESSLVYIALLEMAASQGAVVGCRDSQESDSGSVEKVCVENRWAVYMDKDDLFESQKSYKKIGLDFLFSPFSLLAHFYHERLKDSNGLYLLLTNDFVFAAVFKENTLLFGKQIAMEEELLLLDKTKVLDKYIQHIQSVVKAFYEAKVDENMFIEKIYIADALNFDTRLENRLEEELFVEVEKQSIELSHELALLCEKELS